jgi:hypothetical protein
MKKIALILVMLTGLASLSYSQTTTSASQEQSLQSALGDFKVQGITWHAVTLNKEKFDSYQKMLENVMNLKPMMEMEGIRVYAMENGSKALEKAGYKMLGKITDVKEMKYKFRHFTGPDGLVYGLNEQK